MSSTRIRASRGSTTSTSRFCSRHGRPIAKLACLGNDCALFLQFPAERFVAQFKPLHNDAGARGDRNLCSWIDGLCYFNIHFACNQFRPVCTTSHCTSVFFYVCAPFLVSQRTLLISAHDHGRIRRLASLLSRTPSIQLIKTNPTLFVTFLPAMTSALTCSAPIS